MAETEFKEVIEELIIQIEDALEELDNNIDYESSDGMLTIIMENKSQLIINRQSAALQLWLAAKSGGFHFDYDDEKGWQDDRSGEAFIDILNRCLTEQANEKIELELE
ncbi:MAG: iron donor protein CyaY [gamma proteobacterium symbiont of Lucinoma myriamae]|nr:iron donor protein CyaY [gamma proteobacterium symbiont of Lucinoma myriamae]MCU7819064.1 iron donor protein CyaY [gamma proteobacterium symbiont of Lucinoma myriamae]MCU7832258.1 iron donor protein CyaY [gamma proteobacterium symbiont of Lucinoma myriamae]